MTQAREPEDFRTETERRFGHLNRRLERLEDTQISPQEFARAFERVSVDTTEIKREISELNTKIGALSTELNGKIDTILKHLTGSGDN